MSEVKTLVPKLRFPEFRDSGAWEEEALEELYDFKITNSYSRDKLNYKKGSVKNIHYGDIHTKFSTLFDIESEVVPFINFSESLEKIKPESFCTEGDMVFADASEDVNDVGKSIEIIKLNNEKLLSGLHTLLARQKHKKLLVGFGGYLFKSDKVRIQIKREAQGAKVLGISKGRMLKIDIAYPSDKKEQQKIANCLSSLDELITAHSEKHAALKAHKKGLMQQLFPSEGKTTPKLRFPEFRGDGAWEDGVIADLADTVMGNAFKSSDFVENGIQLIRMGNLYQGELQFDRSPVYLPNCFNEKNSRFLVKPLELLMSMTGTVGKRDYGFIVQVPKNCPQLLLNQRVLKLVNRDKCVKEFLLQLLKNEELLKELYSLAGGTKQANLSAQQFKDLKVKFPKHTEQKKIADCLSFIDELIITQSKKIELLKTHKKGLMQQLFPTTDEVQA